MKNKEETKIPEFQSLEEEKRYWETRGPLTEERKGRINRPKPGQKRSSFLVVRLTSDELTRLRDMAAKYGIGPSTFARILLTLGVSRETIMPQRSMVSQLMGGLEGNLPLIKITCTKCNAVGSMSLVAPNFNGPFKCWTCKAYYTLSIRNYKVDSLVPLTEEELKHHEETEVLHQ